MRKYEVMFIVRPDIVEEDLEKLLTTAQTNIANTGGTVTNVERMGKRRLAYPVRKFADGIYVLFTVEGSGTVIKEFERRLRVHEMVIKFISVRMDLEEQRLAKVKAIRDAHQRGRGTQAAAAAQAAAQAAEAAAATEATEAGSAPTA